MDRVRIYIDGSNLYRGAREACGNGKIQLSAFCRFLADKRPLQVVKYFCVDPPEPSSSRFNITTKEGLERYRAAAEAYTRQISWLTQLAQWGKIEIIKGRLQRTKDGDLREKGVDVALALHLVIDAAQRNFETSIVVSGDSDLILPIQTAISWGKRVEAAAFQPCYHIAATCESYRFTPLNKETIKRFLCSSSGRISP